MRGRSTTDLVPTLNDYVSVLAYCLISVIDWTDAIFFYPSATYAVVDFIALHVVEYWILDIAAASAELAEPFTVSRGKP